MCSSLLFLLLLGHAANVKGLAKAVKSKDASGRATPQIYFYLTARPTRCMLVLRKGLDNTNDFIIIFKSYEVILIKQQHSKQVAWFVVKNWRKKRESRSNCHGFFFARRPAKI